MRKGEGAMADYDFRTPRLHTAGPLVAGGTIELDRDQSHYLTHVLRLGPGDRILAFDGRSGEFLAAIGLASKKTVRLELLRQTRPQTAPGCIDYLFAPLKHARLDYMVQKAVEMGVARLQPVRTSRTQTTRLNLDRMRANAIEAAEQCGVLTIPDIADEVRFDRLLATWDPERPIVFCDERTETKNPLEALRDARRGPIAVLIGPEGGFSDDERELLLRIPSVIRLSLGPRILRADTAAVAALALVQASLGDWGL
jgi:16S rRNA (uracil1498-N3)-methyltransferase